MANGFLGNGASLMLDVVVCALVLVLPVLAYSLYAVKVRRNYVRHRAAQIALGVLLLVTVSAFEIDMRRHGGWVNIVNKPGAEPRLSAEGLALARQLLWLHLVFAVTTPLFWGATLWLALRHFPHPPRPSRHSRLHKTLGWLSTADITLTAITGLLFYYVAFVAPP